jgi:hypothetical protein
VLDRLRKGVVVVSRRRAIAGAVAVLATLLALPAFGAGAVIAATSWIDAPLDGMVLPLAPIEVVAHSADPGLVRAVTLEVDGAAVDGREVDPPVTLATTRFTWTPRAPGTHTLVVRARNVADAWGAPAAVTVVVGTQAPATTPGPGESAGPSESPGSTESPGPSGSSGPAGSAPPTSGPGATPTPHATPHPTPTPGPTPCPLGGPTLLAPPDNTVYVDITNPQPVFEWDWNGTAACLDHFVVHLDLDLQIERYAAGGYFRTYDVRATEFIFESPIVLLPDDSDVATGCGYYSWSVRAVDVFGDDDHSSQVWALKVCPADG